jgi:hypothetical protein
MNDVGIKKNDRLPVVRAYLSDANGYADLTNATVQFIYQDRQRSSAPTTGEATLIAPTSGLVEFAWVSGNVSSAGTYLAEWRVHFPNTKTLSFPNDGYISFEVIDTLN